MSTDDTTQPDTISGIAHELPSRLNTPFPYTPPRGEAMLDIQERMAEILRNAPTSADGTVQMLITDGELPDPFAEAKGSIRAMIDTCKHYENHSPEQWYTLYKMLPLIKNTPGGKLAFPDEDTARFEAFIDGLPTTPDFSQPSAIAALTAKQGDHAPADNPKVWQKFGEIVTELNEAGLQLQAEALLDANGAPSPFLKRAIHTGQAADLFTHANWDGATRHELQATLRVVPNDGANQIGNRHTLLATVGRDARAQER